MRSSTATVYLTEDVNGSYRKLHGGDTCISHSVFEVWLVR